MSFGSPHDDEKRAAALAAYKPREFTAPQVSAAAAAGELVGPNGAPLAPFSLSPNTVRDWHRKAEVDNGRAAALAASHASAEAVEAIANPILRDAAAAVRAELDEMKALRARGVEIKISRLTALPKLALGLADLEERLARDARPAPPSMTYAENDAEGRDQPQPMGQLLADHRGLLPPPAPIGPAAAGSPPADDEGPAVVVRELAERLGIDVPAPDAEPPLRAPA